MIAVDRYNLIPTALVSAAAPSNIALVKYWGKRENQIPANPSVSFTLTESRTTTAVRFTKGDGKVKVRLDGEDKPGFAPKIEDFINRIASYSPIVRLYDWDINTSNTFPHSSGIASSASGMAALAGCLVDFEEICGICFKGTEKIERQSFMARLGSGSACRSVYPGVVVWGETDALEGSSNLYGVPARNVNDVFAGFHDTILLIESGVKRVSSTAGHGLMHKNVFAEQRFAQAHENTKKILQLLENDNIEAVGKIIEQEALSLHAMMLTSETPFILMQPNTLSVLHAVWDYRAEHEKNLYFTLDAGANVHLLYPEAEAEQIQSWIEENLAKYCQDGKMIHDRVAIK